ncbi:lysophosphatidic acid acyltransferase LOA1 ASCRUDRAFT_138375 [Ascoidea rubescens DSM 1968]|uniref:Phospholipid/glycerol acyltransferase domain-containing protein n=1 Tax=Ascoidea rubescens DSM 1968 TaxID=1344418 RepID=A0A1D2VJM4_9ASCO|nr:hypothetical protein ASCRUDRAFT_138375 [Ascoidea rubescens DSM 1968]ODV61816.1 hypothetical protein ASCRUDRAFT_138375 [Ascoidea rubescens DSM 1968]
MEKYSNWRDKGTGIAPFIPIINSNELFYYENNQAYYYLIKLFQFINFSIKFPLFILLNLTYLIIVFPLSIVLNINNYSQYYILNFNFNFLFSSNFCFFFSTNFQNLIAIRINDYNKKTIYLNGSSILNQNLPAKNKKYLVNLTNPLDFIILFLITKIKDNQKIIYLFNVNDKPDGEGYLVELSLFESILYSIANPLSYKIKNKDMIRFNDLSNKFKDKVIFIFPEGTTSNGKSILSFNNLFNNADENQLEKLNIISVKIIPNYLTTPIPVDKFFYLYSLLSNLSSIKFNIKILNVNHYIDASDSSGKRNLEEEVRKLFCNDGKIRFVSNELNLNSKKKFLVKYFNKRR